MSKHRMLTAPRLYLSPDCRAAAPARTVEVMPLSSLRVKKTAAKPEITDQIGRHLRSVYNDVLVQSIPDRFLDLLKDLDVVEPRTSGKKDAK